MESKHSIDGCLQGRFAIPGKESVLLDNDVGTDDERRLMLPINSHFIKFNNKSVSEQFLQRKHKVDIGENMKYEMNQAAQKTDDLIHIIETLDTASKYKKIKIEEVYEILNDYKLHKILHEGKMEERNLFIREKPVILEPHPSRGSVQGMNDHSCCKRKFRRLMPGKLTETSLIPRLIASNMGDLYIKVQKKPETISNPKLSITSDRTSTPTIPDKKLNNHRNRYCRPYMLNVKERRKLLDYGKRFNKSKLFSTEFGSHKSGKIPKARHSNFKVRYLSPEFIRTSDLSIPRTSNISADSSSSSFNRIEDKYRTEPKQETDTFTGKLNLEGNIEEKNYHVDDSHSENDLSAAWMSTFKKLKGDERDLPGIYSRFVRRSKGTCSNIMTEESYIGSDVSSHSEKPLYSSHERDQRYNMNDRFFGNLFMNNRTNNPRIEKVNVVADKNEYPKKESYSKIKRLKTLSKQNICKQNSSVVKINIGNLTSSLRRMALNKYDPEFKTKHHSKSSVLIYNESYLKKQKSEHEEILELDKHSTSSKSIPHNDLMKEKLNMSPTATITMMVLAADKLLTEKSEFFKQL